MLILKVISRLLDYPSEGLFEASDELNDAVNASIYINPERRIALCEFIDD